MKEYSFSILIKKNWGAKVKGGYTEATQKNTTQNQTPTKTLNQPIKQANIFYRLLNDTAIVFLKTIYQKNRATTKKYQSSMFQN